MHVPTAFMYNQPFTFLIALEPFIMIGVPIAMIMPFYFFNKWLRQKMNPRQSGTQLLLYFIIFLVSLFMYISLMALFIIVIAKLLK